MGISLSDAGNLERHKVGSGRLVRRRVLMLHITPWERNALELLAEGKGEGEIAIHLRVAESDVAVHLSRLFAALGAASRTEAVAIGMKRGLLTCDSFAGSKR
jgi:DNA-binding NarL/FixJ family response regulator